MTSFKCQSNVMMHLGALSVSLAHQYPNKHNFDPLKRHCDVIWRHILKVKADLESRWKALSDKVLLDMVCKKKAKGRIFAFFDPPPEGEGQGRQPPKINGYCSPLSGITCQSIRAPALELQKNLGFRCENFKSRLWPWPLTFDPPNTTKQGSLYLHHIPYVWKGWGWNCGL